MAEIKNHENFKMDDKNRVEGTVKMVHSLAQNVRTIMSRITFGTNHLSDPRDLHASSLDKRFDPGVFDIHGDLDFVADHMINIKPIRTSSLPRSQNSPQENTRSNSIVRNKVQSKCSNYVKQFEDLEPQSKRDMFANIDRLNDFDIDGIDTFLQSRRVACKHRSGEYRGDHTVKHNEKNTFGEDFQNNRRESDASQKYRHNQTGDGQNSNSLKYRHDSGVIGSAGSRDEASASDNNDKEIERMKMDMKNSRKYPDSKHDCRHAVNNNKSPLLAFKFNKARLRNAATKTSRWLFSSEDEIQKFDEKEHLKCIKPTDLDLDKYSGETIGKELEHENMKEFENDLVFLSKCGNKMSTPAKYRPNLDDEGGTLSNDKEYDYSNPGSFSENNVSTNPKNSGIKDGSQLDPSLQKSKLLNTAYYDWIVSSPSEFNKKENDRERTPSWKNGQRTPKGCRVDTSPRARTNQQETLSLRRRLNINPLPSLTSLWNPSKYYESNTESSYHAPSMNAIISKPVRRSLSFAPPSSPLHIDQPGTPRVSSSTLEPNTTVQTQASLSRFKSEDEEAVYYLITKYLNKDGDYL